MFNIFLIFFVFSELSFYLLIAQTGVVEVFHSDIFAIAYLPIGGAMATYFNAYVNAKEVHKVVGLLFLQATMMLFYPNLTPLTLFLLGVAIGGISPIIIRVLKNATLMELGVSLGSAYTFGTILFTSNPANREVLGLALSLMALIGYLFSIKYKILSLNFQREFYSYPLALMAVWVFLDSSLFETLSRDFDMSIWRGGYALEIILFHLLGIVFALSIKLKKHHTSFLVVLLFMLSYFAYFIKAVVLLSAIYPFVISYYNIVILQSLIRVKSFAKIGVCMVFIGWAASGGGLMVALRQDIQYIPLLLIAVLLYGMKQLNYEKDIVLWSRVFL